ITALQTAAVAEAAATADLTRLRVAEAAASGHSQTAGERAEKAVQAAAVANNQLERARADLAAFGTVAGGAVCSRCRQKIGPEHIDRERAELKRAVVAAE